MPSQPVTGSRTSSGRQIIVTERAQYHEVEEAAPQTAKSVKRGRKKGTSKAKEAGTESMAQPEFTINTLPTNSTAKRSKTVNLQARAVAVPSSVAAIQPASNAGGQRRSSPSTTGPGPARLASGQVRHIQELCNPFNPPQGQATPARTHLRSAANGAGAVPRVHTSSSSMGRAVSASVFDQFQAQRHAGSGTPVEHTRLTQRSGTGSHFEDDDDTAAGIVERPLQCLTHKRPASPIYTQVSHSDADQQYEVEYYHNGEQQQDDHAPLRHDAGHRPRHDDNIEYLDQGNGADDAYDDEGSPHARPHKQTRRLEYTNEDLEDAAAGAASVHEESVSDEALEDDSGQEIEVDLPIAQRIKDLDGKAKAGDYDKVTQEVMSLAVQFYKGHVSSGNAFPHKMLELRWAKLAWKEARHELDINLQHNSELTKMITGYTANLRSEIKTAARLHAPHVYGFEISSNRNVVARNRARYETLKTKDTFVWRKCAKNLASCQGLYEAKIFQLVASKVYFKGPTDDGVVLLEFYRPFPLVGIALIATAVQCAIDEWAKGTFSRVTFSDSAYSTDYARHLKNLESYAKVSPNIVNSIRSRLFEDGCVAAGVKIMEDEDDVANAMDQDVFSHAAADHELRGGNVSDCEDGDEEED